MSYVKQNDLLLNRLLEFYREDNNNMQKMLGIINGDSRISLRIVDWFATNYAKKHYTVYDFNNNQRFKVYNDYKLNLKAYSKKDSIHFVDGIVLQFHIKKINIFRLL